MFVGMFFVLFCFSCLFFSFSQPFGINVLVVYMAFF